jgi:hypothetical protein
MLKCKTATCLKPLAHYIAQWHRIWPIIGFDITRKNYLFYGIVPLSRIFFLSVVRLIPNFLASSR